MSGASAVSEVSGADRSGTTGLIGIMIGLLRRLILGVYSSPSLDSGVFSDSVGFGDSNGFDDSGGFNDSFDDSDVFAASPVS